MNSPHNSMTAVIDPASEDPLGLPLISLSGPLATSNGAAQSNFQVELNE